MLEAARELRSGASCGEVRSVLVTLDGAGTPAPGGVMDPVIFGPPLPASSSRWGHVAAAAPLLHPLLAPAVARCLELPLAVVWQIAYGDRPPEPSVAQRLAPAPEQTGLAGLSDLLSRADAPPELADAGFAAQDLLLHLVAVPPPAWRPLLRAPGGARVGGAHNARYQALLLANQQLRIAQRHSESRATLLFLERELQSQFEALCQQFASKRARLPCHRRGVYFRRSDAFTWRKQPTPPPLEPPPLNAEFRGPSARVRAVAFVGPAEFLLVFSAVALLVAARSGRIRRAFPIAGASLHAVRDEWAIFRDLIGFHALELHPQRRRGSAPNVPLDGVSEGPFGVEYHDRRRGVSCALHELEESPASWAWDARHEHFWAEDRHGLGGIYRVEDGLLQLPAVSHPLSARGAFAFALAGDDWLVCQGGRLARGTGRAQRLAHGVRAAALAPGGEHLLLVDAHAVSLFVTAPARLRARYALGPLRAWLTLKGITGARTAQRLLARFGWLPAVARASLRDLVRSGVSPARAQQIRAACRARLAAAGAPSFTMEQSVSAAEQDAASSGRQH
ncbi:MAG TPA: hypothetical protein VFS67_20070 [Polyangiaceae bacterium]|nr:hypothetical protein [Polyangiaceae bacterium]